MSEKRFRVRFEQEDGRGEIVNEKGVELSAREVVDLLNSFSEQAEYWEDKYKRREFAIENELERTQKLIFSLMDNIVEKEKENEQLRKYIQDMRLWENYLDYIKLLNSPIELRVRFDDE